MSNEKSSSHKFDVLIRYPKGVSAEKFKDYLEAKNIDLNKMKKYLDQLDEKGETIVLCSDDEEKIHKAITAFYKLGFEVEKAVHFELLIDEPKKEVDHASFCPVCDAPKEKDEPGKEKPCPSCKFVNLPDTPVFMIMKKRIEWQELNRVKEQKEEEQRKDPTEDEREAFKRKMEEKLRKDIRADLMKKYNISNKKNVRWLTPKLIVPMAVIIAGVLFSSGYLLGDMGLFNQTSEEVSAEQQKKNELSIAVKEGMAIDPEVIAEKFADAESSLVLSVNEDILKEVKEFEFTSDEGESILPSLMSADSTLEFNNATLSNQGDNAENIKGAKYQWSEILILAMKLMRVTVFPL